MISFLTKTLYVLLPCYNEEENIRPLVLQWVDQKDFIKDNGFDLVIMPIDDKSTDNTKEEIKDLSKKYDFVKPIYHKINKNLGGVMDTGINEFLKVSKKGDLLVVMDGDNTHKPEAIRKMLKKRHKADVIIASRYRFGSKIKGLSLFRKTMSVLARGYYTLVLDVPNVRDYTCGYRLYSYEALYNAKNIFKDDFIEETSFACMMEILYKLHITGASFYEVPFTLYYGDKGGDSKMNVANTSKNSITTALKLKNLKQ